MALKTLIQNAGKAITNAAADVLSAPARIAANNSIAKSTANFQILKTVNQNVGKPDAGNESDPLFRARVMAGNIKFDADQAAAAAAKKKAAVTAVSTKPGSFQNDYAAMRSSANQ